jgi:histone acetyltransferase (RNA polymerase elongator complex component)
MLSLLDATAPYIDRFAGIRISTRPDYIDNEVLSLLKSYGVSSIELGAQSMDDVVLIANNRGHNSDDVVKAAKLIKSHGFLLGLQMMTGLYKSDFSKDIYTAQRFIDLAPDTVRIYPTVIMKDTDLADKYLANAFIPYTLEESVNLCSELITMFESANIKIIRLGLHYSDSLVCNSYGNNYHPAFKELCESKIFYDKFVAAANKSDNKDKFSAFINQKSLSKFVGQKKSNLIQLQNMGFNFDIKFDNTLEKYDLYIK